MSSSHHDHIVTPAVYARVLAALLALMTLTVVAAMIDLGSAGNLALALVIAVAKMLTIALFFMHVKYSSKLTWVFAGAGTFWFGIMLALTFSDYLTREWHSAIVFP